MQLKPPVPVRRVFDATLARAVYVDWPGFKLDWEFRFGDDLSRYLQVSRGACRLHLTEHHGDCSPGARIVIDTDDVDALLRELTTRPYPRQRPSVERAPGNAKVMEGVDPFGNRVVFNQPLDA